MRKKYSLKMINQKERWHKMNKLERDIRCDERSRCWEEINDHIKRGYLPKYESIVRHGLIFATNILYCDFYDIPITVPGE